MRIPCLAPSVDRRSPTEAPAATVRGEAVRPQCNIRLCGSDPECSGNGQCTTCHLATGICVA
jgi:hypothetical protein